MKKRRGLNIQNRIRKLRNAIKGLRFNKADKEKKKHYIIETIRLKYLNDPFILRNETENLINFIRK